MQKTYIMENCCYSLELYTYLHYIKILSLNAM